MSAADRILVTGATGFIGARLVEKLVRRGKRVRVVTSDFRHCPRVARFPVEMVRADLLEPDAFARAVDGCDTIFHLAYRFGGDSAEQRRANLGGTSALADAAAVHGVRRFVHFSSVAAYGPPFDGILSERTTPRPGPDSYSDTKRLIDVMLRDLHVRRHLPVTFLQPTIVYGPYGGTWTTRLIAQVVSGSVVLPAGGLGLCNAVYVDDVVDAALLASQSEAAVGEAFLISGAAPVTWGAFYHAYERMAGTRAVCFMDDSELVAESRRLHTPRGWLQTLRFALARRPELRERILTQPPHRWALRAGQKLLPAAVRAAIQARYERLWQLPPVETARYVPDPQTLALYAAKTHVAIDKARNRLGFVPAYDLERGMSNTATWARWANLLPDGDTVQPGGARSVASSYFETMV
jgi:nucleoside-diphosphate-sugar epimerase